MKWKYILSYEWTIMISFGWRKKSGKKLWIFFIPLVGQANQNVHLCNLCNENCSSSSSSIFHSKAKNNVPSSTIQSSKLCCVVFIYLIYFYCDLVAKSVLLVCLFCSVQNTHTQNSLPFSRSFFSSSCCLPVCALLIFLSFRLPSNFHHQGILCNHFNYISVLRSSIDRY